MESTGWGGRKCARFRRSKEKVKEVEIESIRKMLARAIDTGHSHNAQGSTSIWMCKVRCWRWWFGNNIPNSQEESASERRKKQLEGFHQQCDVNYFEIRRAVGPSTVWSYEFHRRIDGQVNSESLPVPTKSYRSLRISR